MQSAVMVVVVVRHFYEAHEYHDLYYMLRISWDTLISGEGVKE